MYKIILIHLNISQIIVFILFILLILIIYINIMSKNDDSLKTNAKKTVPAKKNVLAGMNINKLSNMRIIQKHLVYVIGLSSGIANREVKN